MRDAKIFVSCKVYCAQPGLAAAKIVGTYIDEINFDLGKLKRSPTHLIWIRSFVIPRMSKAADTVFLHVRFKWLV